MQKLIDAKIELRDSSRRVLNLTSPRRSLLKNKENLILKKEKARLLYTRRARGNAYISPSRFINLESKLIFILY